MHRATTGHGSCRRRLAMAFAVFGLLFNPSRRSGDGDRLRQQEGSMRRAWRATLVAFAALALSVPGVAAAQQYVYPERGQSPQQQEFDRGQCYSWAVQQTGFDPANPQVAAGAPPPTSGAPQGGMFRGAAGGAALGAVGGAIGGDAGKGAAIGAGVGALFGGFRRMRAMEEEQAQMANYQAQTAQATGGFNRAYGACL